MAKEFFNVFLCISPLFQVSHVLGCFRHWLSDYQLHPRKDQTSTAAILPVKYKMAGEKEPSLRPQSAAQLAALDSPATTGPQGRPTGRATPKAAV